MKKFKDKKIKIALIFSLVITFCVMGYVGYAYFFQEAAYPHAQPEGYRLFRGQKANIIFDDWDWAGGNFEPRDGCTGTSYAAARGVRNTSGNDYFVPTNTMAEWNSFRNNTPSNVTIYDTEGASCEKGGYVTSWNNSDPDPFSGGYIAEWSFISNRPSGYYTVDVHIKQGYVPGGFFDGADIYINDFSPSGKMSISAGEATVQDAWEVRRLKNSHWINNGTNNVRMVYPGPKHPWGSHCCSTHVGHFIFFENSEI